MRIFTWRTKKDPSRCEHLSSFHPSNKFLYYDDYVDKSLQYERSLPPFSSLAFPLSLLVLFMHMVSHPFLMSITNSTLLGFEGSDADFLRRVVRSFCNGCVLVPPFFPLRDSQDYQTPRGRPHTYRCVPALSRPCPAFYYHPALPAVERQTSTALALLVSSTRIVARPSSLTPNTISKLEVHLR